MIEDNETPRNAREEMIALFEEMRAMFTEWADDTLKRLDQIAKDLRSVRDMEVK